jgi:glycogen debranching enzyme
VSADPQIPEAEEIAQPYYIAAHDSLVDEPPRTLKHGDTFALFDHYGDLASRRGNTLGLYHRDTRFLSRLKAHGRAAAARLLLSSTVRTNNAVLDVDLTNPDILHGETLVLAKDTIHLTRMKFLWNAACYELLVARNFGEQAHTLRIDFDFDADFRRPVRDPRIPTPWPRQGHRASARSRHRAIRLASLDGGGRATEVHFDPLPKELTPRHASIELQLPPKARRSITMSIHCLMDGEKPERRVLHAMRSATRDLRAASRTVRRHRHLEQSRQRSAVPIHGRHQHAGHRHRTWALSVRRRAVVRHGVRTRRNHHGDAAPVAVSGHGARSSSISRRLSGAARRSGQGCRARQDPARDAQV